MTVEIAKVVREVVRVEDKTVKRVRKAVAWIGDFELHYVRLPESGEPHEEVRMRHGVQVLDRETLRIPDNDYQDLQRRIEKMFSEERPVKPRPCKKRTPEDIQGRLIP